MATDPMTLSAFESRFKERIYIGSGGFSKVYKAFDHAQNKFVALKVSDVRPEWQKFTLLREVELVNKLPYHPNIARYDACYRFDMGVAGEIDFAILKFYEDGNLEQFLRSRDITDEDRRIIIRGILMGVSFLHNHNYVHRDLKAQNILMQREDGVWVAKITDFGLSRSMGGNSSAVNSSVGISFAYAAPEQIQNQKITKNVDLWAMGVLIYRIISGELPFRVDAESSNEAQLQLELSKQIISGYLPKRLFDVPAPYQEMIRQCLVLDPHIRVQTAEYLLDLIDGREPLSGNMDPEDLSGHSQSRDAMGDPVDRDFSLPIAAPPFVQEDKPNPNTNHPLPHNSAQWPPSEPEWMPADSKTGGFIVPSDEQPAESDSQRHPDIASGMTEGVVGPPMLEEQSSPPKGAINPTTVLRQFLFFFSRYRIPTFLLVGSALLLALMWLTRREDEQVSQEQEPKVNSTEIFRSYSDLQAEQESAINAKDKERLDELRTEWERMLPVYGDDYRWRYQLALNLAQFEQFEDAFTHLREATLNAVRADRAQAQALLAQMDRDARGSLQKAARDNPQYWAKLKEALSSLDESLLQ